MTQLDLFPKPPKDLFVPVKNLQQFGINFSSGWLNRLSKEGRFPPPVFLGPRLRGYWLSELTKFVDNLPRLAEPLPILWPPYKPQPPTHPNMKLGRKPGGRVVSDAKGRKRYVMPRQRIIELLKAKPY